MTDNIPSAYRLAADLEVAARMKGMVYTDRLLQYEPYGAGTTFLRLDHDDGSFLVKSYDSGQWPLVRIADGGQDDDRPILLVTAGMHGDEIAGPLTIHRRFEEIVDMTRAAGLQLVCYPLVNPCGFDARTRYSADVSPEGNNNFLLYQMFDGRWIWDLPADHSVMEWRWSSDPALPFFVRLPRETEAMHEFLMREDWPHVLGAIDLHQDYLTTDVGPGAYHYAYGDLTRYRGIVERIAARVPVISHHPFRVEVDNLTNTMTTDAAGFIVRHDGSLSDLWYRLGVPHALTVETTGATPIDLAIETNIEWIQGLCELVSTGRS